MVDFQSVRRSAVPALLSHSAVGIPNTLRAAGAGSIARARALIDEVGLGKTIEAGLVLKEYLTRGMAKRALILTVPSLVDQWEEELSDKFNLASATTNQPSFRSDPAAFWRDHNLIVASLHTLKQPAHVAVAQTVNWVADGRGLQAGLAFFTSFARPV